MLCDFTQTYSWEHWVEVEKEMMGEGGEPQLFLFFLHFIHQGTAGGRAESYPCWSIRMLVYRQISGRRHQEWSLGHRQLREDCKALNTSTGCTSDSPGAPLNQTEELSSKGTWSRVTI